jgi:hypothetical protein
VDFAISITAHDGAYNGDVGNRFDAGISFFSNNISLTRFWIHSWVKPDGSVEDFYFERTGWPAKFSPECDPAFPQTPVVNYSGVLACYTKVLDSANNWIACTCDTVPFSIDLGGRLASEGDETITLFYPGGSSIHTGESNRTQDYIYSPITFFGNLPPGCCTQNVVFAHTTTKSFDGVDGLSTQIQECLAATDGCPGSGPGLADTCVATTQLDCHGGDSFHDTYSFNGLDSLVITVLGGPQLLGGADFPRFMVTTLGVLALPDLPNPTDGSRYYMAFDGGDPATLSLSNAYKVDPPTFLPENWVYV